MPERFPKGVRKHIRDAKSEVRRLTDDQVVTSDVDQAVGLLVSKLPELAAREISALRELWSIRYSYVKEHDEVKFKGQREQFMYRYLGDDASPQLLAGVKLITESFAKLNHGLK